MARYNFTSLENGTTFYDIFVSMNTNSGEMLVLLILLTVFIVSYISFKQYESLTAIRTSALITSIIGVLFWSIEMLNVNYLMFPIIILGLTIFYTAISKG